MSQVTFPGSSEGAGGGNRSTASLNQRRASKSSDNRLSNKSLSLMHVDSRPTLPSKHLDDLDLSQVPWWTSTRFRLSILYFFGFVCLYAQRVNLSIAMVAMVSYDHDNNTSHDKKEENPNCPSLSKAEQEAEFDWSKELVGLILGAFFWGYLVLQVPGGRLSERFGAKKVVAFCLFPVAILNLLTPVVARWNPYALIILRVLVGVGQSVMYPSAQAFWAQWSPPNERSRLIGFSYAGGQFGNALMFPIGGYLCAYGADGGWPTVFYFIGSLGFFWCCLWVLFAYDSPDQCPTISKLERQYINFSLGRDGTQPTQVRKPSIPWRSILTSMPFWAILVAHMCGNYGAYMLLTKIPAYMKEVLKFDIKANGLYSMLPYLAFWLVIAVGGILADNLIIAGVFSILTCRRVLAFLGFLLPGVTLIGAGFMECDQAIEAVVLLTCSVGLCGLQFCSFFCNHADIAPMYAGTLFGITNTMATIPGIIAPYVVAAMTPNSTREEWQSTFYLAAGIYFFGAVWYCYFSAAEVQPWAREENDGDSYDKGETVTFEIKGNSEDEEEEEEANKRPSGIQKVRSTSIM